MQIQSLPSTPPKRTSLRIQRAVLFGLIVRETRARVEGRWLGLLWMLFEPLAHTLAILGLIGARSNIFFINVDYPVFLITGMLPFFLFRDLVRKLPNAISSNRNLFAYRQVKPIDAVVASAAVEIALYSAVYLVSLCLLGALGYHSLPHAPLELIVVSGFLLAFGVSLGLLFAVLAFQRPKVNAIIGLLFYPLYFASGVIFPLHRLAPNVRHWLLFNPVLHLVELSRVYFIPNYIPLPGISAAYAAAWVLITAALSMSVYRVYRYQFYRAS